MNSPQGPLSWQLGAPLWAGGHKNLQKNSPQPLTRPSCQLKSWGGGWHHVHARNDVELLCTKPGKLERYQCKTYPSRKWKKNWFTVWIWYNFFRIQFYSLKSQLSVIRQSHSLKSWHSYLISQNTSGSDSLTYQKTRTHSYIPKWSPIWNLLEGK